MNDVVPQTPAPPVVSAVTDSSSVAAPASDGDTSGQASGDPSAASAPGAPGQKSPLDILEELLNDARAKPGSGTGSGTGAGGLAGLSPTGEESGSNPPAEDPAALAAQKQAEEAERQQLIAQKQAEDVQKLEEQRAAMEEIKQTPQYQARQQQEAEKEQTEQQTAADQSGFQIIQLEHKKI